MNKTELIDELASRLGGTRKDAAYALDSVVDLITQAVSKGEKVALTGFGVFERVDRDARDARNPRTGETVKVAATKLPKFKPGQGFKDAVSGS